MAFLRQFVAPALIFLVFLLALVATSARIFLPEGLSAPAPVEDSAPAKAAFHPSLTPISTVSAAKAIIPASVV